MHNARGLQKTTLQVANLPATTRRPLSILLTFEVLSDDLAEELVGVHDVQVEAQRLQQDALRQQHVALHVLELLVVV